MGPFEKYGRVGFLPLKPNVSLFHKTWDDGLSDIGIGWFNKVRILVIMKGQG